MPMPRLKIESSLPRDPGKTDRLRILNGLRKLAHLSRELRLLATGASNTRCLEPLPLQPAAKSVVMNRLSHLTGCAPNPGFITDRGTEICTCCGADSGVPADTDITERRGYIDGFGQCCPICAGDYGEEMDDLRAGPAH